MSNPADASWDTAKIQAKNAQLERAMTTVAENLASNAQQPIPSESDVPVYSNPSEGGGPPASAKATVVGTAQGDHPWCVPAATRTTMSAFTSSLPSLSTLVSEENAQSGGTMIDAVPGPLNKRESRNYYYATWSDSALQTMGYVQSDIYYRRAPVVAMVYTYPLKWWQGQGSNQGFHALTIYGYYSSSGGGYFVHDSAFNNTHSISSTNMFQAEQPAQGGLAW